MQDMEIQNGAKLTVRESQMAVFVNEGRIADVFGPGLYTLNTQTLPVLTNLMNWDKAFQSPFKSDVYFFSTRHADQPEVGHAHADHDPRQGVRRGPAASLRHLLLAPGRSAHVPHQDQRNARDVHGRPSIEGQLRNTIVGRMSDTFAAEPGSLPRHGGEPDGARRPDRGSS